MKYTQREVSGIPVFSIELDRADFPDDETYEKAIASSKARNYQLPAGYVDITGVDPASLLKALYDAAEAVGMGLLSAVPGDLGIEEARVLVGERMSFDYLKGRPLKINLAENPMRSDVYDRDQGGEGACARIVQQLRQGEGGSNVSERVWDCQIGGDVGDLPWGADDPMRQAIRQAYRELTGKEPEFLFSGWGGKLSPEQKALLKEEKHV